MSSVGYPVSRRRRRRDGKREKWEVYGGACVKGESYVRVCHLERGGVDREGARVGALREET